MKDIEMDITDIDKKFWNTVEHEKNMANDKVVTIVDEDDTAEKIHAREMKSDYDMSKANLVQLLNKGNEALEDMMLVAKDTEHPRAYEVLAGLMKNIAVINDKIMALNKDYIEVTAPKSSNAVPTDDGSSGTTNNNVFIGSVSDLQRMLQDVDANEKVIESDVTES
tara:strand:- start:5969 stop:6466 length:498 start_codon:yes stop_codon:yes gene_type:complete